MAESEKRESWGSRVEFLLSCAGYSVGFGNIWRFSYLAFRNGGGAFMLPYLCCVVIIGYPIVFMEVALGQFTRRGAVGIWKICPLLKGIGYCSMLFAALESVYYNIIMAWVGYYFVVSFSSELPWTHCYNDWNTDNCSVSGAVNQLSGSILAYNTSQNISGPETFLHGVSSSTLDSNLTYEVNSTLDVNTTQARSKGIHPAEEFWTRGVLQLSEGIEVSGDVCLHLLASLAVCWIVCYFCAFRGVRWSGKVVYFTATFPYILLIILLIQAARQDGSANGVTYYIKPQFHRLADMKVWFDAASQVLFSCAVALTVLPAYGSYCPYNSNCFRDTMVVSMINSGTSILVGFVVFSMLGYMSHTQNEPIENVATSGPGLAFIVYPQAINLLPVPQVWAVLFFFMMILVGLDSQFSLMEGVVTSLLDVFPRWFKWRMWVLLVFVVVAYLLGISMITQGGMYIFQLVDCYLFGAYVLVLIALLEVIGVSWIYGADRFLGDIESMMGHRVPIFIKICWMVLTPLSLVVIMVFNIVTYKPLTYNEFVYPGWANAVGFIAATILVMIIPLYAVIHLKRTPGNTFRERLRNSIRPGTVHYKGQDAVHEDAEDIENSPLEKLAS